MQMETFMTGLGKMIKPTDSACIVTSMEQDTKGRGKKTSSMAKVSKHGLTEQAIKETI